MIIGTNAGKSPCSREGAFGDRVAMPLDGGLYGFAMDVA